MDQRTKRLGRRLGDSAIAKRLVSAGLTVPKRIKAATDRELRAISGIGAAAVTLIRDKIG